MSDKDLQFPTHHFTNDPSGKLTLGIMFSISKHFSDDLSRKVKRGVSGNFDDGKLSGSPKWGYKRSIDRLYRPDVDWVLQLRNVSSPDSQYQL